MVDGISKLVVHAAQTSPENIPKEVCEKTKTLFLDTMGCILAGSSAEGIVELKKAMNFWGGNKQATVFSEDIKTSAPEAAFINSVMCHANDFDDTHDKAVNHGCVTIVPALIATCEAIHPERISQFNTSFTSCLVSGKEFIAALAVGLDVANRLGMAFIPYLHTGWLPTTLWGPFGCVAACGRILNLDTEKMHNAFGLAYSQIHGNRQALADGRLAKRMQPGFSAAIGVRSAFYAAMGITGAENIIDGSFGIPALYTLGKVDYEYLTENIGEAYETSNISIKPYPCCRCTHPVIDAALELKDKHNINWEDIEEGTIYLPPNSMGQIGNQFAIRDNPTVDAQFSAQYTASLAFIKGRPRLEDFNKEKVIQRKEISFLATKFKSIEYEKDKSGITPVRFEIKLKNGKELSTVIEHTKGSSENPLTEEELLFKFNDCLDNSIIEFDVDQREKILKAINNIEYAKDICEITCLFNKKQNEF
ncbi:MAG: MmgE/PrpD family protein [Peptococcales bacterium]|jgi:2-methylcitrate dehydratase PrpD